MENQPLNNQEYSSAQAETLEDPPNSLEGLRAELESLKWAIFAGLCGITLVLGIAFGYKLSGG